MGSILKFVKNKEPLKIEIEDYVNGHLNIIYLSDEYFLKHIKIFLRKNDKNKITKKEFGERLHNYLWTPKISELIIILYLEDLKNIHPNIYEINKLIKRTSSQNSTTLKCINKLESLDIVYTEKIKDPGRSQRNIFINKKIIKLYGAEEFKQMMLDEWGTDAKVYIKRRINFLSKQKEKIEKNIKMSKKGKRVKNEKK